jgi:hypothetical protein
MQEARDSRRPVHVALGIDIGAGTSFSLLVTMNEAYKVGKLADYPMSAVKSFYLTTRGGAEALGLAGNIGSLEPGHEADLSYRIRRPRRCWTSALCGQSAAEPPGRRDSPGLDFIDSQRTQLAYRSLDGFLCERVVAAS